MDKIDVVVVTYNRLALLKECLEALSKQINFLNRIYIINNCSNDGTTEYLKEKSSNPIFKVFNLNKNIGGAGGFEYGIREAYKDLGNYVWIMDDDAIPTEKAAYHLLNAAKQLKDDFGFLCSNDRWIDGAPTNIPKPASDWTNIAQYGLFKVENATFVSILVRKKVVRNLGLPIGKMFIWGDDTEYTKRISVKYSSYLVPKSIVIHKSTHNLSNDSVNNVSSERIERYKFMYRNLMYLNRKYSSKKAVMRFFLSGLLTAIACLKANSLKLRRMTAVISGLFKGIFFDPKISYVSESKLPKHMTEKL